MIYLKKYNEAIKDFLKPISDHDRDKILSKKSIKDIIYLSIQQNYVNGLKLAVDMGLSNSDINYMKNLITDRMDAKILEFLLSIPEIRNKYNTCTIYIIEKYKFGLHQQDELKECEIWFIEQLINLKSYVRNKIIIYKKDDVVLFNYNDGYFYVDYDKIWSILESKFELGGISIMFLITSLVQKYLKLNNITPIISQPERYPLVQ